MSADELAPKTVSLPGGLLLGDNITLTDAELRPLTGREEDWLARHHGVPSAIAVTRLLGNCELRLGGQAASPELVRRLLVGDRDYLMLQLRCISLGDDFRAVLQCPLCGDKMDVTFKAGELPVERRPQTAATYSLQLSGRKHRKVQFRLPTGADQEAILGLAPAAAIDKLLKRCLLGRVGRLSASEREQIARAMEGVAPRVETELDLTCPECQQASLVPFDATAFFLYELRSNDRQLLREFHGLAFYYHWS